MKKNNYLLLLLIAIGVLLFATSNGKGAVKSNHKSRYVIMPVGVHTLGASIQKIIMK